MTAVAEGQHGLRRLLAFSALQAVTSVAASAVNYLFQVVVSRLLPPEEFAKVQSLFGVYMILTAAVTPVMLVFAKRLAQLGVERETSAAPLFFAWLKRTLWAGGAAVALVGLPLVGTLETWFRVEAGTLVVFAICVEVAVLYVLTTSLLTGLQRFYLLSLVMFALSVLRVLFAGVVAAKGGGVTGVLVAQTAALSVVIGVVYSLVIAPARGRGRDLPVAAFAGSGHEWLGAVALNTGFNLLTQLDVVYANHNLGGAMAGDFAAAATIAKLLPYVCIALSTVFFPSFGQQRSVAKLTRLLLALCAACAGVALVGLGGIALVGPQVLRLLLGEAYAGAGAWLVPAALAMAPYALLAPFVFLSMASGRGWFPWLLLVAGVGEAAFLFGATPSLQVALWSLGWLGAAVLLVGVLSYSVPWLRKRARFEPVPAS